MLLGRNLADWKSQLTDWNIQKGKLSSTGIEMKTVVTVLLAFLFIWISLCCGRVLLTGGYRPSFCSLPKGMYDVLLFCTLGSVPMNAWCCMFSLYMDVHVKYT